MIDGTQIPEQIAAKKDKDDNEQKKEVFVRRKTSLKAKVLSRVFSEDYERVKRKILDPRGPTIRRWNKIFLVTCLISLFVDPLFFYLPVVRKEVCIDIGIRLEVALTIVRSVADIFYVIHIFIRFRTAYIAPSSRVFGRGELVIDTKKIANRYLRQNFWIDLLAALPLPQVCTFCLLKFSSFIFMYCTKIRILFFLLGADVDRYPESWWLDDDEHEERSPVHLDLPVPSEAVSYISSVITNCQSQWCCHRNSMGWGCL